MRGGDVVDSLVECQRNRLVECHRNRTVTGAGAEIVCGDCVRLCDNSSGAFVQQK